MSDVLIVESRFYPEISDSLKQGAIEVLKERETTFEAWEVPGAFEIPGAIRFTLLDGSSLFKGYIALGCVIRGQTSHYDHICDQTFYALQTLVLREGVALGNGVLTVDSQDQAWKRAKNKGNFAARACLTMMALQTRSKELYRGRRQR